MPENSFECSNNALIWLYEVDTGSWDNDSVSKSVSCNKGTQTITVTLGSSDCLGYYTAVNYQI